MTMAQLSGRSSLRDIVKLVNKLDEGFDVVYGTSKNQKHGLSRHLVSNLTKGALQRVIGTEAAKNISAFRAFRTRLRDGFKQFSQHYLLKQMMKTWNNTPGNKSKMTGPVLMGERYEQ